MLTSLPISRFLLACIFFTGICTASETPYFKEGERLGLRYAEAVIYQEYEAERFESVLMQSGTLHELMREFFTHDPKSPQFRMAFSHLKTLLQGFKKEIVHHAQPIAQHKHSLAFFTKWIDVFISSDNMATLLSNMGRCVSELSKIFSRMSPYGKFRLPFPILPNTQSPEYTLGQKLGYITSRSIIKTIGHPDTEEYYEDFSAASYRVLSSYFQNRRKQTYDLGHLVNALIGFEKGFEEIFHNEDCYWKSSSFNASIIRLAHGVPLICIREFFAQKPLYKIIDSIGKEITACGKELEVYV